MVLKSCLIIKWAEKKKPINSWQVPQSMKYIIEKSGRIGCYKQGEDPKLSLDRTLGKGLIGVYPTTRLSLYPPLPEYLEVTPMASKGACFVTLKFKFVCATPKFCACRNLLHREF